MSRLIGVFFFACMLALASCGEREQADKPEAEQVKGAIADGELGQAAADEVIEQQAEMAEMAESIESPAAELVVPVAARSAVGRVYLSTGILVRSGLDEVGAGQVHVAFLVPPDFPIIAGFVWLGSEEDGSWVKTGVNNYGQMKIDFSDGIVVAPVESPEAAELPALDLGESLVPSVSRLRSLQVAEFGELLSLVDVEDPEKIARLRIVGDLWERCLELLAQATELSDESREQYALTQTGSAKSRRAAQERSEKLKELQQGIRDRRAELTGQLKYRERLPLSLDSIRYHPPKRRARIVTKNISAEPGKETDAPDGSRWQIFEGDELPANGVAGTGLTRRSDSGMEVIWLASLEKLMMIPEDMSSIASAHFLVSNSRAPVLEIAYELPKVRTRPMLLTLKMFCDGAEVGTVEGSPRIVDHKRDLGVAVMGLDFRGRFSEGNYLAEVEMRYAKDDPGIPVGSLKFSLSGEIRTGEFPPQLGEGDGIRWMGPIAAAVDRAPVAKLSAEFDLAEFVGMRLGASGRLALVQSRQPNQIRVLDLVREEWGEQLKLPVDDSRIIFTADAEALYVWDGVNGTLSSYGLPELEPKTSVRISVGHVPESIAAGYAARGGAVCLLSDGRVELRNPADLSPVSEVISDASKSAMGSYEWLPEGALKSSVVRASPCGTTFCISEARSKSGVLSVHNLFKERSDWVVESENAFQSIPFNAGAIILGSEARSPWLKEAHVLPRQIADHKGWMLGAGAGIASIVSTPSTLPPSRFNLVYYNNVEGGPLLGASGCRAGQITWDELRQGAFHYSDSLFVLPDLAKIVGVREGKIMIEHFLPKDGEVLPTLSGALPASTRGTSWEHLFTDPQGAPLEVKLISGPRGASVKGGRVAWAVPSNYPERLAAFELEIGSPPTRQNLRCRVVGEFAANIRRPGADEGDIITTTNTFTFPERIDRLLPCPSDASVVVVSGGHRRFTVIDLKTLKIGASINSARGPATSAITEDQLLIWSLDGNIVERRQLPGLQLEAIRPVDASNRFYGLITSTESKENPPLALFLDPIRKRGISQKIDLETLGLGPPTTCDPFADDRRMRSPVRPLLVSPDGSLVLDTSISNSAPALYTRHERGRLAHLQIEELRKINGFTQFAHSGRLLFRGSTALDTQTKRSWSIAADRDSLKTLWPDIDHANFLVISIDKNAMRSLPDRTSNMSLTIFDLGTREPVCEIDQLREYDKKTHTLFKDSQTYGSELLFSSKNRVLLTTNPDGMRIIARRLPEGWEQAGD